MEFGDFLRDIEHSVPASEQTKRELLDVVITKAREAYNTLPYPKVARNWSDDGSGGVVLSDWSPDGRYYDPPAIAEITFYEKNMDGFDKKTTYEFLEGPDSLGLAKYVELTPVRTEQEIQVERAAIEMLTELMDKDNGEGLRSYAAWLEENDGGEDDEIDEEDRERLESRMFADELGESLVFESEAAALLDMIRTADWSESRKS